MQIKKYTDYGLRTLIYLGTRDPDALSTINEICDAFAIPRNHVNKVIHQLGKEGFIITRRGKNGGFRLAMAPNQIRLDDVVRKLEGDTPWVNCHSPACKIEPVCELKNILARGKKLFYDYLARYTLQSLLQNRQELERIFVAEV